MFLRGLGFTHYEERQLLWLLGPAIPLLFNDSWGMQTC